LEGSGWRIYVEGGERWGAAHLARKDEPERGIEGEYLA
jgi:hypothetical protein